MPGQFHAEPAHVHRLLAQPGDLLQCADRVPGGDGVADLKEIAPVGHAGHAAHQGFVHRIGNTGAGVQDRERVPHGAVGQAADQFRRSRVQVDFFLPGHIFQPAGDLLGRDAGEVIPLAAGQDGGRDLLHLGGGQDEDDVFRRFLHRLEQGVEGRSGEHVDLVDDVHLILAHRRQVGRLFPQVPDVVHTVVGGRVDLRNIQDRTLINALADRAFPHGSGLEVSRQLTALAKILAQVVLPVPRVPVNR